jgi:hypothetical protein
MASIADVPVDDDVFIELAEHFIDPLFAAEDQRLASYDLCTHNTIGVHEGRRKVTGPDILSKCCCDTGADRGFRQV